MEHALQRAVDRLPEILEKNAPAMMRRIVAHMRSKLTADGVVGNVSHGMLFLKVGEEDLVREFLAATTAAFVKNEPTDFGALSLEPEGGKQTYPEFAGSDAAFDKLCADAANVRVSGFERYDKGKFLGALGEAFVHARMDSRATAELLPYAKVALNAELQALYTKLDELAGQRPAS
jgi:hypothetical protein